MLPQLAVRMLASGEEFGQLKLLVARRWILRGKTATGARSRCRVRRSHGCHYHQHHCWGPYRILRMTVSQSIG